MMSINTRATIVNRHGMYRHPRLIEFLRQVRDVVSGQNTSAHLDESRGTISTADCSAGNSLRRRIPLARECGPAVWIIREGQRVRVQVLM